MKIAILDDYQDSVRHLPCFSLLAEHEVKVFTSSARGVGQLAIRLAPFDALVLIRERTALPRQLLAKLPNLKLISQTGKVSGHIDVAAATAAGITIVEGVGDPTAPAELTWTLIMAASRNLPQYLDHLKDGLWQTASLQPAHNTLGTVPHIGHLGLRKNRPDGGGIRPRVRHEDPGLGPAGKSGNGSRRGRGGCCIAASLLRGGRCPEPASAVERGYPGNRRAG